MKFLLFAVYITLNAGACLCTNVRPIGNNTISKFNSSVFNLHDLSSVTVRPSIVSQQVLWQSGEADVNIYRCPLLTYTPGGNLLVVAEGRKGTGDGGLKFIATRRSSDEGFEWATESFIHDDSFGGMEDNLGAVLVDDVRKEIYIFYIICAHPDTCSSSEVPSLMYVKSKDDGISWKPAVNVTAIAGPKNFAPGPGYGIQKKLDPHKGRLIVCGHGGTLEVNGNFCLLSDDHGKTWRWGAEMLPIPAYTNNQNGDFVPDECQPIELPDGSIMLNTRNQYRFHCNCRMVSRSYDGMETIARETIGFDEALVEPAVSASILSHLGVVFFSNPASETSRTNMMLRWSYDNGTTWSGQLPIWEYASGYSCLTAFPEYAGFAKQKYLYLVFEKGKESYTDMIEFVRISIDGTL
ncbi:putative sialidase-1 [Apostichopus japonicus]|uniref:Sialidase-1 n=1 Tax=Stichopus japonicus TaxID=307972 RepID=A0A2G8LP70_STIJA|nr:putative sialidase-1 [Apostichopus japonicus]